MALHTPEANVALRNATAAVGNVSGADAAAGPDVVLPSARFATDAAYLQQGDDLVLVGRDGTVFVVRGYFLLENPPDLITPEGGRITPELVDSFTPPESVAQYAQVGQLAQAAQPIGQVKDLTGDAFAVRTDGTRAKLSAGDPVYQGDVIETGDGGAVNMVFVDETTFALGEDARLALDEMVYNPATQSGSSSFSIMKGVFVFVSGKIAHADNTQMQVNTPVATIGIRGTKVAGDIKPAGEESKFTVIDGEIAVATQGGTVVMGDRNATTTVTSFDAAPTAPVILSQSEVNQHYSDVGTISGGLLNNAGPAQQAPTDTAPRPPAGADTETGGEGGSEGAAEGGAGEQEAAGEGNAEGEGEGTAEAEGEGGAEGAGGEGEGGSPRSAGPDGPAGEGEAGSEGEGSARQAADGEGAPALKDAAGEGAAEAEGEGGRAPPGDAPPQTADGEGGEAPTREGPPPTGDGEGGEAGTGDAPPRTAEDGRLADGGADQTADEKFSSEPAGTAESFFGSREVLDGGNAFSGDPLARDSGFGDLRDPLSFDGAGDPLLSGTGFTLGEPPPPPPLDDPPPDGVVNDDGTFTQDPPFFIDLSAEVTPQNITGGNNADTLIGGSAADIIDGFQGDDTLVGNGGDDTLFGGSGDDTVSGGAGNDLLIAGSGQGFDTYDGGAGTDTLSFTSTGLGITADMSLGTASGSEINTDTFTSIEVLIGGVGADTLNGSAGADEIHGRGGDDTIDGGGGVDTIFGDTGNDTIGFDTGPETIDGGAGIDRIKLLGAGQTVDGSNLVSVSSIEEVDLSGIGSNTLSISSALITAVSGTGTFSAFGDGDDVVDTTENWNLGGPVTSSTVTFDRFSNGTTTIDSATNTFRSSGTINFDAGATLTNNIINLGTLTTSDGTYTNNGSITLGGSGDIDMTGSKTLAGTGTFINEQVLSLQDDIVSATLDGGTATVNLEGTVTIDGALILGPATTVAGTLTSFITGAGTLVNQGTQLIDGGDSFAVDTLINQGNIQYTTSPVTIASGTIENTAGATVDFAVNSTIDMVSGQTLTNAGLMQLSSSIMTFLDGDIANSGTLDVVAASSTLDVSNGVVSMLSGSTLTGAGSLFLTSSSFDIDTGYGLTLGTSGTGPHLNFTNGSLGGAGTLVNESNIIIDGASSISVATLTNSNGGTLDHANGTLGISSVFENQAGGTLFVDTNTANTAIDVSNSFSNSGVIQYLGVNQGALAIGSGSGTLSNTATGTVQVIDGDNILDGTLINPSGGVVEVNATGSGLARLDLLTSFTNNGLLHLTAGATPTQIAAFDQNSAGLTLTNIGAISMDGGIASAVLEYSGNLDNQGLITANTPSDARIVANNGIDATMTNSGTIDVVAGTVFQLGLSGAAGNTTFSNSGTFNIDGDIFLSQTTLTNTGVLQLGTSSEFAIKNDSILNLNVDFTAASTRIVTVGDGINSAELGGTGTLTNQGVLNLNDGTLTGNILNTTGLVTLQGASNLNSGVLDFDSNSTLVFSSAPDVLSNSGTINVNNNSTLTVDTGTLDNLVAGTINVGGTGTIATSTGGVFNDNGTTNFGLSPGSLTIDGDMTRGDNSFMLFELGGLTPGVGGFDQFSVTGALDAGGTMSVVEFGTFDVGAGDSFAVVNAGTITSSYREISGLEVGGGVVLDAVQSATGVTLVGKAVTHQGTAGGDTLTGSSGNDVIVGEGGNDTIAGGGGADLLHGGAGNDLFVASDTSFGRLDGGGGVDTVRFDGGSFDLTGLRGDQLSGVERFDLTGTGDNTLTLNAENALAAVGGTNPLTNAPDSLLIDGNAGDAVDAQGAWTNTGTVTIGGNGYSVFESGDNGAQIFVDTDVTVNVNPA